jgi:protein TIF31
LKTGGADEETKEETAKPEEGKSEYEERLKKSYEEFMSLVERESKKEIPMPPPKRQTEGPQLIRELFRQTPSIEAEMNKVQSGIKSVEAIQFSNSYNPVPPYRRMVGDLFYLVVKTVDSGEHGITCSVNGFYRNDNVEKQHFSPGPSTTRSPCLSYTLVGCLYQLSPSFGKNLEKYFNSILATEPYFLTQLPLTAQGTFSWIVPDSQVLPSNGKLANSADETTLVPLFGLDPRGVRDWNEEFQVVKDFPKETLMQRIQRDRAVAKVYNDFLEAAVKGAVAIVGGNLTPLNPNEASRQQVFVYNQIFFSFAVDLVDDAPFRDLTSLENNPSFTQANHDLLGLRALQILDCEGLHVLATTIVNYRGHRVIAQSIIPGILNNNDLASLAEYGSVDEHKTIYAGEEFHNLMKKVCGEQLSLKTCRVVDGTGKEVEIAGSVEVKGIRGTDKRCYLVDLQGLTPRDLNYADEEKHHTCLLRPELLLLFQRTRNIEYATSKMSELPKP